MIMQPSFAKASEGILLRGLAGRSPAKRHRREAGWWGRQDSNLRSHEAADLQSAPFATRDTPPFLANTRCLHPNGGWRPVGGDKNEHPVEGRSAGRVYDGNAMAKSTKGGGNILTVTPEAQIANAQAP